MKNFLKKIVQWKLRVLAVLVLRKYQPKVVAITGSVGKTSTKEAIYTVLASKFKVRKNIKNYNNEIGVPLTILGFESGNKNIFSWLLIFVKSLGLILFRKKNYPEVLVLEFGADRPGDIQYLVDFIPCKIGVITAIGPVHLEFFGKLENIVREKGHLVTHLSKDGFAILNQDDDQLVSLGDKIEAQVMTYGFSEKAKVKASELKASFDNSVSKKEKIQGSSFKLANQGHIVPVFLPKVLGQHQVYAALAAAACGIAFDLNLVDIAQALRSYQAPAGRMNLIEGIKYTLIIDDSYNASPQSTLAALKVLKEIPATGRKFAALGDMLELGNYTEEGHQEVGRAIVKNSVDYLVTVGEKGKIIAQEAARIGFPQDKIFTFDYAAEAGKFLQDKIEKDDLILVKGSQGARMEKIVKELMAEPLRAKELLVRQDRSWVT